MHTNKTKLGVVTLMTTAIVCFIVVPTIRVYFLSIFISYYLTYIGLLFFYQTM